MLFPENQQTRRHSPTWAGVFYAVHFDVVVGVLARLPPPDPTSAVTEKRKTTTQNRRGKTRACNPQRTTRYLFGLSHFPQRNGVTLYRTHTQGKATGNAPKFPPQSSDCFEQLHRQPRSGNPRQANSPTRVVPHGGEHGASAKALRAVTQLPRFPTSQPLQKKEEELRPLNPLCLRTNTTHRGSFSLRFCKATFYRAPTGYPHDLRGCAKTCDTLPRSKNEPQPLREPHLFSSFFFLLSSARSPLSCRRLLLWVDSA